MQNSKIIGYLFIFLGVIVVFFARQLVNKFSLETESKCDFEEEMDKKELEEYKYNKALVKVKIIGMIILFPGIFLIFDAYR